MLKRLLFTLLALTWVVSVPCELNAAPRKNLRSEKRAKKEKDSHKSSPRKRKVFTSQQRASMKEFLPYIEKDRLSFGVGKVSEFTFSDNRFKAGFIGCIGGMQSKDWQAVPHDKYCFREFFHHKIFDAEKSDLVTLDDGWCGQLTEMNMLSHANLINYAGYHNAEEYYLDLLKSTTPHISPYKLLVKNKTVPTWKECHFEFSKKTFGFDLVRQTDKYLRMGCVAWFEVDHGYPGEDKGGHAMTLLGFTYNTHYSKHNPNYYTGIIIADSDDYGGGFDHTSDAPNRIRIAPIFWDKKIGSYWLYGVGIDYMTNIFAYHPPKKTRNADLTWYQPNGWMSQMVINNTPNVPGDNPVLRNNENLYLNFAITNQGRKASGNFYVTLYIDDKEIETFTVHSVKSDKVAVLRNYQLKKLPAGVHTIKTVIDSNDDVSEDFECNNTYKKNIIIYPAYTPVRFGKGEGFLISQDTTVKNIEIHSQARMYVRGKKALLKDASVKNGAFIRISDGGKTLNTQIKNGGIEDVFVRAVSQNAQVFNGGRLWLAGGKSYDAVVHDGGLMEVREHNQKSSYSANTKLLPGGRMNVFNHSLAEKITVESNGFLRVYFPKAVISDVTILSGGLVHVWKHGTAQNVYVAPGGVLELREESPVLKGTIRVAGQLKASFDHNPDVSQAEIILDLTKRRVSDVYYIENLDFLKNANISVNISRNQKIGSYKIASGAVRWNGILNVTVDGQKIQSIRLWKPVKIAGKYYTLNRVNSKFIELTISFDPHAPDKLVPELEIDKG